MSYLQPAPLGNPSFVRAPCRTLSFRSTQKIVMGGGRTAGLGFGDLGRLGDACLLADGKTWVAAEGFRDGDFWGLFGPVEMRMSCRD